MKKQLISRKKIAAMLAAAVLVLTSAGLYAQEQQSPEGNNLTAKFGIKGGINFTNLYVADVSRENMKIGFNAGLFAKLPITKGFSIQPELLYTVKGAKDTYSNFIQGNGEYRYNLNYLELPVLAVVNLAKNFNLHAGGYAAYLVSATVKDVRSDGTIVGAKELRADDFKRFDYGLVGGLGIDITNFTIGARYNYGLSSIGKAGSLSGSLTKNSKNSAISVYLGFAF
jgi:hypothetical protein